MKSVSVLMMLSAGFCQLSCSSFRSLNKKMSRELLGQEEISSAHIGISLYDVSAKSFLYNYQAEKYFTPASNTKLFSLFAGLKYLGDSLIGIRYIERDTDVLVIPTGDPTLLHRDFPRQPVVDFLKNKSIYINDANWKEEPLGAGWSWDDYNDDFMIERSPMPVYGNFIQWAQVKQADSTFSSYSVPDIDWKVDFADSTGKHFYVKRNLCDNIFIITQSKEPSQQQDVPFVTHGISSAIELLKDTVSKKIFRIEQSLSVPTGSFHQMNPWRQFDSLAGPGRHRIYSQPVDSLFIPMMHRSDNFFAEQTLLMVSNERLGYMNDAAIINALLSQDLKDLPQKPVWVDGSGLSRYNLFSPKDFVWLLDTLQRSFGLERIKKILPTGGTGTLGNYYKADSGRIYAKTGSLSGVICLSGYLVSAKNHLLIFSVLANNYSGSGTVLRRAVEKFLESVMQRH